MTKITTLLEQEGPVISFEFFPPKTDQGAENLRQAVAELRELTPSFVSVTYGAGGSTRENTREVILEFQRDPALNPMPHLTCVAHNREELVDILTDYRKAGIDNVLALHGDLPKDQADGAPVGDLERAAQLVGLVREVGDFSVAAAAHPEGHPKAPDQETDRRHQAEKLRVADVGITQFFFRAEDYFRLMDDLSAHGVATPVMAGIIPITNVNQIERFADLSGADLPDDLVERLRAVADDPEEVHRIGVEVATDLAQQLLDGGAPGLHFYTLNRAQATREVYENLGFPVQTG